MRFTSLNHPEVRNGRKNESEVNNEFIETMEKHHKNWLDRYNLKKDNGLI
jgi:hypothetical protein